MDDIQSNPIVDPNTDDLDAFQDLMDGKAKAPEPKVEPEKVVDAPTEDDTPEDDTLETELTDGSEEEEKETPALSGKKNKKTFQERINELTAKAREAERREQETLAHLAEIKSRLDNPPEKKPENTAPETDGPNPDAILEDGSVKYPLGEFDPAYIRDLTKHTIAEEQKLLEAKREQTDAETEKRNVQQALMSEWETKLEAAEEKYEDLRPKAAELEDTFRNLDPAYGEYLVTTIMSLDAGPDVLYYLANNLDEAKAIVASGATKATIALGRLEGRLAKEDEVDEPRPTPTRAPTPPIVQNKGSSGGRATVRPDTDDLDAFEKAFYSKK